MYAEKRDKDSYLGENPLGEKRSIKKEEIDKFLIHAVNITRKSKYIKHGYFIFNFKCKPEIAKTLKDKIVIVGEFSPVQHKEWDDTVGYTSSTLGSDSHSPTILEPYEKNVQEFIIYCKMISLSFVNRETKEVLKTFKIQ